ncbi:hypothetical protein [Legionella nagasakiensis]|uniref:hypothetical protein n=1 Tax=Legionella nagasakiensis TaxID=535290 RepID=UPI001054AE92|nr:hypothetical protein [Legionella nagasakiensis]
MKEGLNSRLMHLKETLTPLQRDYPSLLSKLRRWTLNGFIHHPAFQDLSDFEQTYFKESRDITAKEEKDVTRVKNQLLSAVTSNKSERVQRYLSRLFGILQTEITELKDAYLFRPDNHQRLQAAKNFAQFELATKDFYRGEFALRCNIGRLYCTLNALTASLQAILPNIDEEENDRLIEFRQQLDEVEAAQHALTSALAKYEVLRPVIKEQVQSTKDRLITHERLIAQSQPEFLRLLRQIRLKSEEMTEKAKTNDQYDAASKAGKRLHIELKKAAQDFFKGEKISFDTFDTFYMRCNAAIETARPVLKEHRGWGKILADLAFWLTSTVTFGLAPLANKAFTGEFRFFKPLKTDSEQKLDAFVEKLMDVAAPQFGA